MKNHDNAVSNLTTYFKSLVLLMIMCMSMQYAKAQTPYKITENSQFRVALNAETNTYTAQANVANAEGSFIVKDGVLDDISSFKLVFPMYKTTALSQDSVNNDNNISFELTHIMVLPMIKMIHVVGMLNVDGVSQRTDMEFSFVMNEDQSITLTGTKSINLNSYLKEPIPGLASLKNADELKLNMNLIFKADQPNLANLNIKD